MKKWTIIMLSILVLGYIFFRPTIAEILEDGVEVKENTELIYYLDVTYDGVDVNGIESTGSNLPNVYSDYIYVEDKLPEGLTFTGFKTSEDGSIGAVSKNDPDTPCLGYVVDGVDGLKYNNSTRTVSFTVKNLQAGCKLTVGIKTTTPNINDPTTSETEVRRDFYNTATATEEDKTENSNTVHVWMGKESLKMYSVTYKYAEGSPENAPELPPISSYGDGSIVGLEKDPILEGYKFNGWKTSDVAVVDGKFTMPKQNVTFEGSFTAIPKYRVSYKIDGEFPSGYVLPSTKEYYEGSMVTLDVLKAGDVLNDYRFLGWETKDGVILNSEKAFSMPNKNVEFVGKFEEISYKVEYKFQGSVMPPSASSLLPAVKQYKPGEKVKLEKDPVASDYNFLGWYYDKEFVMPEQDITIYGEWEKLPGIFNLSITKSIIDEKPSYENGDEVSFEIEVKNENDFAVSNVVIQEQNEKASLVEDVEDSTYTLDSDHIATIPILEGNQIVTIKAVYKVDENDKGIIDSTAEIIGAEVEGKTLNPNGNYKATQMFKVDVKEKPKDDNPNTYDAIMENIFVLVISVLGLAGVVFIFLYVNKKNKNKK